MSLLYQFYDFFICGSSKWELGFYLQCLDCFDIVKEKLSLPISSAEMNELN